jgi:hypothetical protein
VRHWRIGYDHCRFGQDYSVCEVIGSQLGKGTSRSRFRCAAPANLANFGRQLEWLGVRLRGLAQEREVTAIFLDNGVKLRQLIENMVELVAGRPDTQ